MTNEELRRLCEIRKEAPLHVDTAFKLAAAVPRLLDDIAARDKVIEEVSELTNLSSFPLDTDLIPGRIASLQQQHNAAWRAIEEAMKALTTEQPCRQCGKAYTILEKAKEQL